MANWGRERRGGDGRAWGWVSGVAKGENWSERGVQRVSLRNSAGDFLNLFSIGG